MYQAGKLSKTGYSVLTDDTANKRTTAVISKDHNNDIQREKLISGFMAKNI
jgi:hypothetical protein